MRALAIETSGRLGSVAIVEDQRVLQQSDFPHGLKHAAGIVQAIDKLMRSQGWEPRDLQALYVSAGPGSFTGLRIGITLAKTLAFATGAKVVAVPTVEVLARNAPPAASNLVIVLDAKREQIFTARLHRATADADWMIQEPAHLDSLRAMLARSPRPVHLLGEGIAFHRQFIAEDDPGVIQTPEALWNARASHVAALGARMLASGQSTDPYLLTPVYIRKPEAEEKFEAAQAPRDA